jgi:hypothetical protein
VQVGFLYLHPLFICLPIFSILLPVALDIFYCTPPHLNTLIYAMSAPEADHYSGSHTLALPDLSGAVPTSTEARAKRRIAALEDELETMRQERRGKQRFVILRSRPYPLLIDPRRKTTFYVSQGRAIRRMGVLYTNLEDLIAENDRRYEEGSEDATPEYVITFFVPYQD